MHLSIENKVFITAVHIVARFAERRGATLPALSSILLLANEDAVKMRATNLDAAIDYKLRGQVKAQGAVAIPAALLQQIASSLTPEGTITLEHSGDTLVITSGMGKLSIKTTPYEDFPSLPFPEDTKHRLILSASILKPLLATIAGCASTSTIRPELASLFLSIEANILTAAATDSFRLAEKKVPLANKGAAGTILIPAKNALEIAQALPEEDIILSFDEHQCAFIASSLTLISRLTNAAYPDYHQIIPKESVAEATVLRHDFETVLRRSAIFADVFQKVRLTFDPKKKQLLIHAHNKEIGESSEAIAGQISGEAVQLSFNYRYLAAILALTRSENLTFTIAGIGRPLIIRGTGDNSLLYLVSPMNQ